MTADSDRARIVKEIAAEIGQVEAPLFNVDLAQLAARVTDLGFAKEALQLARSHGSPEDVGGILISVGRVWLNPCPAHPLNTKKIEERCRNRRVGYSNS